MKDASPETQAIADCTGKALRASSRLNYMTRHTAYDTIPYCDAIDAVQALSIAIQKCEKGSCPDGCAIMARSMEAANHALKNGSTGKVSSIFRTGFIVLSVVSLLAAVVWLATILIK